MTQAFTVEFNGGNRTATVRLIRSEEGNRLNLREIAALGPAIREAGSRREAKLVVIRGDGPDFCLGRSPGPAGEAPKSALGVRDGVTQPILDAYENIRATPVPVLAMVQGRATGFGCALVAQCDLAIAADDAVFSLPEMDHHLPPTLAISAMLHKAPIKRVLHMVYTRDVITAAEALSMGIVGRIVPRSGLESAVLEVAAKLSDRNRAAICAVKEYATAAANMEPNGAARLAGNLLATVLSSPKEE